MNIIVFGDSILKGVRLEAQGYARDNSWEEKLAAEFSVTIRNRSRFGCTVEKALPAVRRECAVEAPGEMAVVEFGGNDCDYNWKAISEDPDGTYECKTPPALFRKDYREILETVKASGRIPLAITLPPIHSERYLKFICRNGNSRENILRWLGDAEAISRWQAHYSAMVREITAEAGIKLLDLRAAFPKDPYTLRDYLCEDGIHPSLRGQRTIYETLRICMRSGTPIPLTN